MSRRRRVMVLLVVLGAVGSLAAASAQAATYCVNTASCTGGTVETSIGDAFAAASNGTSSPGLDTIQLGPGTYPYSGETEDSPSEPITLVGAGRGQTTLVGSTVSSSSAALTLVNSVSSVTGLSIEIPAELALTGQMGLVLHPGSSAQDLAITADPGTGAGVTGAVLDEGAALHDSLVDTSAVSDSGSAVEVDNASGATTTIAGSTLRGYRALSDGGLTTVLQRDALRGIAAGARLSGSGSETLSVSSTLVELAPNGIDPAIGFDLADPTAHTNLAADNVTVVRAPEATAGEADGIRLAQTEPGGRASATVSSSVFWGLTHTEVVHYGGAPSGHAVAHFTYTDADLAAADSVLDGGTGAIVPGAGDIIADPAFLDPGAGNYGVAWSSPLVDAGDTAALSGSAAPTDLLGSGRILASRAGGPAVRDIGAVEYRPVAPSVAVQAPAVTTQNRAALFGAAGVDANAGEAAALRYTWQFSDGSTATGASVFHTAAIAGPLTAAVTVTDPTGFTGTASTMVVVAAALYVVPLAPVATPISTPIVVPVDHTPPVVTFAARSARLKALVNGKPVSFVASVSEAGTATSKLELLVVTDSRSRRHGRTKVVTHTQVVVLGSATATADLLHHERLTFRLTKRARASLIRTRKTRAATLRYVLATTARDTSGNITPVVTTIRVR